MPGRALDLRVNPFVSPDDRLAYDMLAAQGFALPWIEERRDLLRDRDALLAASSAAWHRVGGGLPTAIARHHARPRWEAALARLRARRGVTERAHPLAQPHRSHGGNARRLGRRGQDSSRRHGPTGGSAVHAVVNHLHFKAPVDPELFRRAEFEVGEDMKGLAGFGGFRAVLVSERHVILIIYAEAAQTLDDLATRVGNTWMRDNVAPLLAQPPERHLGEVIAVVDYGG